MKPKIIFSLALVLSGMLCVGVSRADDDLFGIGDILTAWEPSYLGRSLSQWIRVGRPVGELLIPGDQRAGAAVQAIGTNALPCLLHWIHSVNPETVKIGMEGFGMLGPIAKPAVPELMRQINDWRTSTAWSNAIPALAAIRDTNYLPAAMTFLLTAATNADAPGELRLRILQSMREENWGANEATSVLIFSLKDEDWRVVAMAARALVDKYKEPLRVVPALMACLASHTNMQAHPGAEGNDPPKNWDGDIAVRNSVLFTLREFSEYYHSASRYPPADDPVYVGQTREAMLPVVPVLINNLYDEDGRVARAAAMALGDLALQPDLAVPALLKSMDRPYHNDPYGHVRLDAIDALGNFVEAAHAAVPTLTKLAETDLGGYVGGPSAAAALKKIVPPAKP